MSVTKKRQQRMRTRRLVSVVIKPGPTDGSAKGVAGYSVGTRCSWDAPTAKLMVDRGVADYFDDVGRARCEGTALERQNMSEALEAGATDEELRSLMSEGMRDPGALVVPWDTEAEAADKAEEKEKSFVPMNKMVGKAPKTK